MADERILAKCAAGRNGDLVLSPAEGFWSDCPCVSVDPSLSAFEVVDDFTFSSVGDVTSKWMKDADTGIAVLGSAATYGLGGVMVLSTTASKNKYVGLKVTDADAKNSAFRMSAANGKKLWFGCKFKVTDLTDDIIYIGLIDGATTKCATDNTGAEALADGVYFRVLTASPTKLDFAYNNTAGTEVVPKAAINTLIADTWVTAAFKWDGVGSVVPYINGVAYPQYSAKASNANFPTAVSLAPRLYVHSGNGTDTSLVVDWIKVVQAR